MRTLLDPRLLLALALTACGTDDTGDDTDTDTDASETDDSDTDDTTSGTDDTDDTTGGTDDTDDTVVADPYDAYDFEGDWYEASAVGNWCYDMGLSAVTVTATSDMMFSAATGAYTLPCSVTDASGGYACATSPVYTSQFVVVGGSVGNCGVVVNNTVTGTLSASGLEIVVEQTLAPTQVGALLACPSDYACTTTRTITATHDAPVDTDTDTDMPQ